MRTALAAAVGLTFLAGACGGSSAVTSGGTTSGPSTGSAAGSGSTTGSPGSGSGATGSGGTTTGGTGAGLAAGQPCSADSACASDVCGVGGSGKCCVSRCETSDLTCGATACDDTGACVYPTKACGPSSCSGSTLSAAATCDKGTCVDGGTAACPDQLLCDDAGVACLATCTSTADCALSTDCNAGSCIHAAPTGPCTEDDDCLSQICSQGPDAGAGACCLTACPSQDPACTVAACDPSTGACIYPEGAVCGAPVVCANAMLMESTCDAHGSCIPTRTACPKDLGCDPKHDACNGTCLQDTDCASGAYCDTSTGSCLATLAIGACSENAACVSGICGIAGTGHCCAATCTDTTAPCGATDCDGVTAQCSFPGGTTACGSVLESCSGTTQQNPSACTGDGGCDEAPGTTDCSPYICGAAACLATCTTNADCASADFCDSTNSACCSGLQSGGTLAVDSKNGKDAACCGIGTNAACQTLHQAMTLIDAAEVTGVTITATVGGQGGDWTPAKEVYPIVLGWGAELSAPGVYFNDQTAKEVIDISPFSANDIGGGASLAGSAGGQVVIGQDSLGKQSIDSSALRVESGETLSIANALVNGNATQETTALSVAAGASLLLGSDQSGGVTGSVDIGSVNSSDGWEGIVCESNADGGTGCTITDATLQGAASVVITNQEDQDLLVGDFGTVTLTSSPTIGVPPPQAGFLQCSTKLDMSQNSTSGAVLLRGSAALTFSNGVVQCIDGEGFELVKSANGTPKLTLSSTTIQNTELAIYASAGAASVSNCTIEYNYDGVEQDTDGVDISAIDLSGGGVGTNTIVCSNSVESDTGASDGPGVDVLNTTTQALKATGVDWDTAGPDLFSCGAGNVNCTCEDTPCTDAAGTDDMNAVYTSSGLVTTTGNGLSTADCSPPGVFCSAALPCQAWETCCTPSGARKSHCVEGSSCN